MNLSLQLLEKAALEGRIAHLLLFHGGSTIDRRAAGVRLAQVLNCISPTWEGPCEACPVCKKIRTGNHPDVEVVEPDKSSLGIEQVLAWQERVYRKHFEGKYKVFILEGVDRLTLPAANALLKIIEEPPERTLIILSTQNAEALLPTIQSRAQLIYFPEARESQWLASLDPSIDPLVAREAYYLSGETPELTEAILEIGITKIQAWIEIFRQAIDERDFLKIFSLFPMEKGEATLFLQCLAQAERRKAVLNPVEMLAIGKAIEQIKLQANPRLVIEVLVLELFRQGGNESGRGRGGSF